MRLRSTEGPKRSRPTDRPNEFTRAPNWRERNDEENRAKSESNEAKQTNKPGNGFDCQDEHKRKTLQGIEGFFGGWERRVDRGRNEGR
jgi:hypothetical protein